MRLGLKELIIGTILLFTGAFTTLLFLDEFILILKGAIGPAILLLGFLISWIGFEDLREGI